jgi:hypothetical protein
MIPRQAGDQPDATADALDVFDFNDFLFNDDDVRAFNITSRGEPILEIMDPEEVRRMQETLEDYDTEGRGAGPLDFNDDGANWRRLSNWDAGEAGLGLSNIGEDE